MTETDYAEFDELHRTWLARPHLHLFEIISLARGIPPRRWGEAHQKYYSDCLNLKACLTRGLLKAHRNSPSEMKYDNTVICLSDLLKFLDEEVGLEVEWLRKFAERWRRYCALPAIKVDDAGRIKPRATYDVDEVTRTYQRERARLDPFPTEKEDKEWFQRNFPDLPRAIWRDQIRVKIAPDDARKRGPRSKVAR